MKARNYIFILLGLIVMIGLVGIYFYNKPASRVTKEKPLYEIKSEDLFSEYTTDEATANKKYLGKVIEVTGTLLNISSTDEQNQVTLMLKGVDETSGISCKVDLKSNPDVLKLKEGSEISIKGICTGMLMDVVLVNCSVQNS